MTSDQSTTAGDHAAGRRVTAQESLAGHGQHRGEASLGGLMGSSVGRNLGLVVALLDPVRRRRRDRRRPVRQRRQRADDPAARLGDRRGVGRHDLRDHRRRHRPVGRRDRRAGARSGRPRWPPRRWPSDVHWSLMVLHRDRWSGTVCGLVNGLLVAYGRVVPFIATLAMLAGARGLAEIIAQRRTQIVDVPGSPTSSAARCSASRCWCIIFVVVAALGWVRAQPHDVRPPHLRRRRQPRGGPAGRHQRHAGTRWRSTRSSACAAASPR